MLLGLVSSSFCIDILSFRRELALSHHIQDANHAETSCCSISIFITVCLTNEVPSSPHPGLPGSLLGRHLTRVRSGDQNCTCYAFNHGAVILPFFLSYFATVLLVLSSAFSTPALSQAPSVVFQSRLVNPPCRWLYPSVCMVEDSILSFKASTLNAAALSFATTQLFSSSNDTFRIHPDHDTPLTREVTACAWKYTRQFVRLDIGTDRAVHMIDTGSAAHVFPMLT